MVLDKIVRYVLVTGLQWLILFVQPGYAQDLPVTELQPVEIQGQRLSPFAIGAQTTLIDSMVVELNALPSLAELLNNYTAVGIKSYGNGMLSTISFRGTGPSHTAVLWHGVNITYPMLGQSDLSLLSLALNNELSIQHGTGSALFGSGALGGTISLANKAPERGAGFSVSQWFGSFGTLRNQLRGSYANDHFFVEVKTLWDQAENNFSFTNTTKPGLPTETQQGASYLSLGSSLESGVHLNDVLKLRLSAQYFNADRNLQPSINANFPADNQTDENIRTRMSLIYGKGKTNWQLTYAYLHDAIGFNGEVTLANQQVARTSLEYKALPWFTYNLAADYNHIQIKSPFYAADKTVESRGSLWGSLLFNPLPRLVLSLNLRQAFVTGYIIPFTPSLGAEYQLIARGEHKLGLKAQVARGYRVPTLNERFWEPGGNPDLLPEESYSAEFGVSGQLKKQVNFNYEVTAYRMWVDNWVLWRPQGSFWSPENIKYVDVYGLELAATLSHTMGKVSQKWIGNYALTKSINRTGLDQYDRSVDKQLAYVPIHKASFTSISQWQTWSFLVNVATTGERFITADNENAIPGYTLINLRVAKSFALGNYKLSGNANINNLFNTQYQSIENKAMPGINFLFGVTLTY